MLFYYYDVSFLEHKNGQQELFSRLFYSGKRLDPNMLKEHLKRNILHNPAAVITISTNKEISKEEYLAKGGLEP